MTYNTRNDAVYVYRRVQFQTIHNRPNGYGLWMWR